MLHTNQQLSWHRFRRACLLGATGGDARLAHRPLNLLAVDPDALALQEFREAPGTQKWIAQEPLKNAAKLHQFCGIGSLF